MPPSSQIRVVKVKVDTSEAKGIASLSNQFSKFNKNLSRSRSALSGIQGTLNRLKTAFGGLAAAFGVREIARSIDSFQLLKDRIRALSAEGENVEEIFQGIARVAKDTNQPIEILADGYARIAVSASDLGIKSDEILRVTQALTQTLRISGATAAEVNSVFLQFSQSLGLGRLQGQELRAVLLGNAKYASLLAEEFGVTRGELRQLGEEGKLTSDRTLKALIGNFDELNNQASKLRITIGQATVQAFDALRLKFDQLNKDFDITGKFVKGVKFLLDNLNALAAVVGSIVAGKIFYKLAAGVTFAAEALIKFGVASKAVAFLANPGVAAAIAAVAAGLTSVALINKGTAADQEARLTLDEKVARQRERLYFAEKKLAEAESARQTRASSALKQIAVDSKIKKAARELLEVKKELFSLEEQQAKKIYDARPEVDRIKEEIEALKEKKRLVVQAGDDLAKSGFSIDFDSSSTVEEFNKLSMKIKELESRLRSLNNASKGQISSNEKVRALAKKEGGITREVIDLYYKLERAKLAAKFDNKSDIFEEKKAYESLNAEIDKLIEKYEKLNSTEQLFRGIEMGAESVIKSIGTLADQISKVTINAFGSLEDALFDFIKTGQFEFKKFVQSILDDLLKVVIRMQIIKPLAASIAGGTVASAKGNIFQGGNVVPFATGGIIGSPTTFPLSGGRTGLAGEAGPEAIIPLKRTSSGELGVKASGMGGGGTVVNVINNSSNSETETRRSTGSNGQEQIDVLIVNKVNQAIGDGQLDKSLSGSFGLTRRGI